MWNGRFLTQQEDNLEKATFITCHPDFQQLIYVATWTDQAKPVLFHSTFGHSDASLYATAIQNVSIGATVSFRARISL